MHVQADEKGHPGILSNHSRGLTLAQMLWPVWEIELRGHLDARREFRPQFGGISVFFLADHQNNVRLKDLPGERVGAKHMRWHLELTSDGSEFRGKSGVSALDCADTST